MRFPIAKSLQAPLETDNSDRNVGCFRSFVHQSSYAVICNEMHYDFFADHIRTLASQDVHTHCGFDVAKEQFDIPPFKVKVGQFLGRILCRVKQGSDNVKLLSSEAWIVDRHLDLSQDQFFRQLCPLLFGV